MNAATRISAASETRSQYQLHLKTVAGHSHMYDRSQVSVRVRRSDSILEDERYVCVYVCNFFLFFRYPLRDAIAHRVLRMRTWLATHARDFNAN